MHWNAHIAPLNLGLDLRPHAFANAYETPVSVSSRYHSSFFPYMSSDVEPSQSSKIITYNFDEVWAENKSSWSIRVSQYGSVYCIQQQWCANGLGTWYNLRANDTESADDEYGFD